MLAPAGEALDLFQTSAESLEDTLDELLLLWYQLDPEVVDLRYGLLVQLYFDFFFLCTVVFFLFIRVLLRL